MRIAVAQGADVVALVRAAASESVTLVIADEGDSLWLARMLATVAPIAIERAPAMRVNAVLVCVDAVPADVDAAVAFLDRAESTTGQVLRVTAP